MLTGRRRAHHTTADRTGVGPHAHPRHDVAWHEQAACRDHDPELWYPTSNRGPESDLPSPSIRYAIEICRSCPVRKPCATAGLREPHGIWGGMTEQQRRRVAARLRHEP